MDSVARIVSSMRSAAKDVGLKVPTDQQVKDIIGLSLPQATQRLFPNTIEEKASLLHLRYKKHYIELDDTPTPLFSHAEQLFSDLLSQGKLLAVATGKGREGLDRLLRLTDTKQYFHSSRCASECQSKPHPEMLYQLLDEFSLQSHEAVMIGDSVHDLSMAEKANVDSIGVSYGVHDYQALSQHKPKAIVNSLRELSEILLK